jgi:hypothetical protein
MLRVRPQSRLKHYTKRAELTIQQLKVTPTQISGSIPKYG